MERTNLGGGVGMAQRKNGMMAYNGMVALLAFSFSLLWSVSAYAQKEGPETVCVLQVRADGDVMAVMVDDTRDIDVAVLVPRDNVTNLPIRCTDLDRIGLAVANQEAVPISFGTSVYTNNGELKCTKGPFHIDVNGGQGVTFKNCP
jgi:hypothetical protein